MGRNSRRLPKSYGKFIQPNPIEIEPEFDQIEIQKLQNAYTNFIKETVLTKTRVELLRDYGPKKVLIVAGQYDHARDSNVIIARRLRAYGMGDRVELLVVDKAYHGFFTCSSVFGGFEEKDDEEVLKIVEQVRAGIDFNSDSVESTVQFLAERPINFTENRAGSPILNRNTKFLALDSNSNSSITGTSNDDNGNTKSTRPGILDHENTIKKHETLIEALETKYRSMKMKFSNIEIENTDLKSEVIELKSRISKFKQNHVSKMTVEDAKSMTVKVKQRYMHSEIWYNFLVLFMVLMVFIFLDLLICCDHNKFDYERQLMTWIDFSRIERLLNRQC